ncbi:YdcF family protein [Vibrio vulnificus]|uniref:SanA/YdcF family protein n=1 Tax=Vibrio vulnificus TaxID=672 RepID=UPI001A2B218D|nr:ElyC/SanA/YdcF family protein [Vibrio vulnificus]EGR0060558.1 SanA protein [Vibrio vulnificus]EIJ0968517.1 YdcF family protein [Vibrio vulnificus]EIO4058277.1 YdcF family protein [Vibrio vulnificus]EIU7058893.1 YdcF family protein [Vibrio vulnificus]ELV8756290.1 YdcF family protein [Vibrio vulnificus]
MFDRLASLKSWISLKRLIGGSLVAILCAILFAIIVDRWVSLQASDKIITSYDQVEGFDVAVVLGTSKYIGRTLNTYYTHRIDAAIELYRQNKVQHLLLSGDNAHRSYNEPWTMKRDLLKAGVPETNIHLDYAGFRTLDSIVRAKKIFASDHFLIVTQRFHCERALFIANAYQINARCLAVSGPSNSKQIWSMRSREVLARVKAFIDLYVINTQPRFLGPQEPIALEPLETPLSPPPAEGSDSLSQ